MAATHIQHFFSVIITAFQELVKQVDINIAVSLLKFVLHERRQFRVNAVIRNPYLLLFYFFDNLAIALTGNVPTPLNLGGIALKVKPSLGNKYKLQRCSTIKMFAPKSVV